MPGCREVANIVGGRVPSIAACAGFARVLELALRSIRWMQERDPAERLRRSRLTLCRREHKIGDGPVEREVKAISERDRRLAPYSLTSLRAVRALDQAEDGAQRVSSVSIQPSSSTTSAELAA